MATKRILDEKVVHRNYMVLDYHTCSIYQRLTEDEVCTVLRMVSKYGYSFDVVTHDEKKFVSTDFARNSDGTWHQIY